MSDQRQNKFDQIKANGAFDVVVIGGGVNGIGVYRDLALQGLRVLMVERNDFCSGCSAAPSRMIHGGLRYLENGEFDLVRESLDERDALLRNAPHMVRPLPTVIPITTVFSGMFNAAVGFLGGKGKPSNRGAVPINIGLTIYDWITRKRQMMPRHTFHFRGATLARWPLLTSQARMTATYHDAWISHPERLCIEMIRDVERGTSKAMALNYGELSRQDAGFLLQDRLSGAQVALTAKVIVNASGAWVDETAQSLSDEVTERMVSGTKGSHLILDNPALLTALGGHMVYFENTDGRVCIVFPYQGKVLVGSTDIRVEKVGRVRCEADEQAYILTSVGRIFPSIPVASDQIVFSYSGIRPLPESDQDFTGRISRGHLVRRLPGKVPQFCMVGGKWTTYRAFGEQTTDAVLAEVGRTRQLSTKDLKIGGGDGFPRVEAELERQLARDFGISAARAHHLVWHYGAHAVAVLHFCAEGAPGRDAPLSPNTLYSQREIIWLIESEYVETLSDIVLRRTSLAITGVVSMQIIAALARLLSQIRGFTPAQVAAQQADLLAELDTYHGVSPKNLEQRDQNRSPQCD